jgi:heat shock protein HslJ
MTKFRIIVSAVILIACFMVSCEKNKDQIPANLIGEWTLMSVEYAATDLFLEYPDTLENWVWISLSDSNVVHLEGYCNSGSGIFETDESAITFRELSMTEMACPPYNEWEDLFYLLTTAKTYEINGHALKIFLNNDIALNFDRIVWVMR